MPVAEGFRTWVQFPPPPPFPRPPCGAWINSRTAGRFRLKVRPAATRVDQIASLSRSVSGPLFARLPGRARLFRGEEVVVRRVVDSSPRPDRGLRAAGRGRDAADGIHPLDARDLAERAGRTDGLRDEEQPGNGIGRRRVGTLLQRAEDLAAIGRFPMRAGVVSADPVTPRVEQIGLGGYERPFVSRGLIPSSTAFVDLHALRG